LRNGLAARELQRRAKGAVQPTTATEEIGQRETNEVVEVERQAWQWRRWREGQPEALSLNRRKELRAMELFRRGRGNEDLAAVAVAREGDYSQRRRDSGDTAAVAVAGEGDSCQGMEDTTVGRRRT
jgi:hypothetical protein